MKLKRIVSFNQPEEITTIQVHGERISSENRLEIERERETKERKN